MRPPLGNVQPASPSFQWDPADFAEFAVPENTANVDALLAAALQGAVNPPSPVQADNPVPTLPAPSTPKPVSRMNTLKAVGASAIEAAKANITPRTPKPSFETGLISVAECVVSALCYYFLLTQFLLDRTQMEELKKTNLARLKNDDARLKNETARLKTDNIKAWTKALDSFVRRREDLYRRHTLGFISTENVGEKLQAIDDEEVALGGVLGVTSTAD